MRKHVFMFNQTPSRTFPLWLLCRVAVCAPSATFRHSRFPLTSAHQLLVLRKDISEEADVLVLAKEVFQRWWPMPLCWCRCTGALLIFCVVCKYLTMIPLLNLNLMQSYRINCLGFHPITCNSSSLSTVGEVLNLVRFHDFHPPPLEAKEQLYVRQRCLSTSSPSAFTSTYLSHWLSRNKASARSS